MTHFWDQTQRFAVWLHFSALDAATCNMVHDITYVRIKLFMVAITLELYYALLTEVSLIALKLLTSPFYCPII